MHSTTLSPSHTSFPSLINTTTTHFQVIHTLHMLFGSHAIHATDSMPSISLTPIQVLSPPLDSSPPFMTSTMHAGFLSPICFKNLTTYRDYVSPFYYIHPCLCCLPSCPFLPPWTSATPSLSLLLALLLCFSFFLALLPSGSFVHIDFPLHPPTRLPLSPLSPLSPLAALGNTWQLLLLTLFKSPSATCWTCWTCWTSSSFFKL